MHHKPPGIRAIGLYFTTCSMVALIGGVTSILHGMSINSTITGSGNYGVATGLAVLALGAMNGAAAHSIVSAQAWLRRLPCAASFLTLSLSALAALHAGAPWTLPAVISTVLAATILRALARRDIRQWQGFPDPAGHSGSHRTSV